MIGIECHVEKSPLHKRRVAAVWTGKGYKISEDEQESNPVAVTDCGISGYSWILIDLMAKGLTGS